ncbi:23S rRNA (adenine(2503)-C(2))-methyltransferase RlmN [Patescibacteria group bacterium]|nr:23S rRNA (adenine(2503)-C(2))-methyltransferase RlmN [Patescibacteria group bacterium]MBU0964409.1 23S rRNA (adenine(2503)-C(2))-methyltransferase RlmN [Patescibacteria group bacterium]
MDIDRLEKILKDEKPYRLRQVRRAVFHDFIDDWSQATTLAADLRKKLNSQCPLGVKNKLFISADKKTIKALLEFADAQKAEAVLMRHRDGRNTVCVSSQIGCPVGCVFCATGQMGLRRNLALGEIIEQVLVFSRFLKKDSGRITNVVFMGMGEPFLNYDNVVAALRLLNSPDYFGLGSRKLSISTAGIVPGIEKFGREDWQVNLAVSLHAPDNALRTKLMPINKVYPIEKVLAAVDDYIAKKNRRVMFEYLMIKGVNDSEEQARQLAKILNKPLYMVNLIRYNQTGSYYPSESDTISKFMQALLDAGLTATQRYSFGHDIKAACGQLAAQ